MNRLQRLPRLCRHLSSAPAHRANQSTSVGEVKEYPPVKPKYPPGTWGKMDHKYAWKWQEMRDSLLHIPDVQGRLSTLLDKETLAMASRPSREHRIHNFDERIAALIDESATAMMLEPFSEHPSTLQFRQYATKSIMLPWKHLPKSVFENIDEKRRDEAVVHLTQCITDHIQMEYEFVERGGSRSTVSSLKSQFCRSLIQCICESLIAELGKYCNHLQSCQYDQDVIVRALWSRHGLERKIRKFTYDPDENLYDTVHDQGMVSEGKFDAVLRSHLPLPEFEPVHSSKSEDHQPPTLMFKPWVYGQSAASSKVLKSIKSILAGHRLGDPSEFGLVGVLSTCNSQQLEEECGAVVAQNCRLAMGLTNTFTWLAAQACNQGFSHIIDLTYPLTSQTVLTDGQVFSFLAYQLNSLELWKDDDGNSTVNLCWHTPEMPLYHSIEDGKVREINVDVVKLLVQTFMLAPMDRGYEMKPSICEKADELESKEDFIPQRVIKEELVEEEKYIV